MAYIGSVILVIGLVVLLSVTLRKTFDPKRKAADHVEQLLSFPSGEVSVQAKAKFKRRGLRPHAGPIPPYMNLVLLSILLIGFDTGMKLSVNWAQTQQKQARLEKENVENQLAFLRNQVSPHFLMNTLNNIHTLIGIDENEAKSAVVKLSRLMRHLLYESDNRPASIKKEMDFISSYIELMKLRFTDAVDIQIVLPDNIPDKSIPSLLFTNLLENAFKHGISYMKKSFVHVKLFITDDELTFLIVNSKHARVKDEKLPGIGLENTKRRLELLYKDRFEFEIQELENTYSAKIKIPV